MACLQPNTAWQVVDKETGEVSIKFKMGLPGLSCLRELKLPCGNCLSCKMDDSKDWATRVMHEASCWESNCTVTLTYSEDKLPPGGSLRVKDWQDFFKRLRSRHADILIRELYCGEYGDKFGRPHFHGCIFNFDFTDKYFWREKDERKYYRSMELEELWPYGLSEIGDVTWKSAAYIARYVTKKINGSAAKDHYQGRKKEFLHMSVKPGIGKFWFEKFNKDVYPSDEVILDGRPISPPRYYDKQLEKLNPELLEKLKAKRVDRAQKYVADQTLPRRKARLAVLKSRYKLLKRSYENGTV